MKRGYVRIGKRFVHYRRAGSGPAVILLHASPVSSAMFLEQIGIFSRDFTAIAIDTPWYGLSTPLDHPKPEIADFADAVAEFIDALGLGKAALYGRHTGASIAVETARRHPDRVSLALCDGYPVFTPAESDRYLEQYLVPVEPRWDGGHLAFWFLRYRDQHVFWPWDLQETKFRADTDVPDVDFLHRGFNQIMIAGEGYKAAYSAAFRHDSIPALEATKAKIMLTARPGDSLYAAFATTPPLHEKRELSRDTIEATHQEVAILKEFPGASVPGEPARPAWRDAVADDRFFLDIGAGQIHARLFGTPDGRDPLVVLAPVPGGIGAIAAELEAIGAAWPLLAVEAPGQSDSEARDPGSVETAADWIGDALEAFGVPVRAVMGWEGSSAHALELARRFGASVLLLDPPAVSDALRAEFAENYTADLTPHVDGRHVPIAWTLVRDERLWTPFYRRERAAALPLVAEIEPDRLHARAVDLFKQPANVGPALAQLWAYPLSGRLDAFPGDVVVIETPQDRFRHLVDHDRRRVALDGRTSLPAAVERTLVAWL